MEENGKETRGAAGFWLTGPLPDDAAERGRLARDCALRHFPWLKRKRFGHGAAELELWSHHDPAESVHEDTSGNLLVLIGSVMNDVSWPHAVERLARQGDGGFELPWEGRCILIRLSPDGKDWTMWNDWCGSIPVFHTSVKDVPAVSSLEPPIVDAAGFTEQDLCWRGIIEMLMYGHFLGTDTLFAGMQALPPDSVSRWRAGRFAGSKTLWSVAPSDSRWHRDEDDLTDEMHALTVKAVGDALRRHDRWVLPLSGGMDSRLIACVGAERGADFQAYTYGPATWDEPIYARQVARALNIPWRRVDVGADYLADYTPMWFDWFGSSLHAHGMYQMPFLLAVRDADGPILQGFMGDPLAGNHLKSPGEPGQVPVESLDTLHGCPERGVWRLLAYRRHADCPPVLPDEPLDHFEMMWTPDAVASLLRFDPADVQSEIADLLQTQLGELRGADYQRLMFLDFWNRQRTFIFYQPAMYDYWKGVCTPYMNREYARFFLSLPRDALQGRRLQKEMLKRYWPRVAKIAGTYAHAPLIATTQFAARRMAARLLPRRLRIGPVREFNPTSNMMEPNCVAKRGMVALWPLGKAMRKLDDYFNTSLIADIARRSTKDLMVYLKLPPIQTIAYRLM